MLQFLLGLSDRQAEQELQHAD
ncbi:hypothetical protein, partial [Streptomyces sanglieri]